MFTGLIEAVGQVEEVGPAGPGFRLSIRTDLAPEIRPGDSVAVNGVCLTAVEIGGGIVRADVSPETARVTTLGRLGRGALVNLERPLPADARIGGHFVQGHVDATGAIESIREDGDSRWVSVRYPRELAPLIVHKGSIAVDGISLTVAGVDDAVLHVQVIPFTWDHTNLRAVRPGTAVNLECDILGKYVVNALRARTVT